MKAYDKTDLSHKTMIHASTGILNPDNVWVSGRTDRTHGFWKDLGAHPTLNNNEVVNNCDIIFLTVKPNMLDDALNTIVGKKAIEKSKLFISVLAGVSLEILHTVSNILYNNIISIFTAINT